MQYDVIVVHYHEVGLKGRNRGYFERTLIENIKRAAAASGYEDVRAKPGRVVVTLNSESDPGKLFEVLSKTFGVTSFSPGVRTKADLESITATSLQLAKDASFDSFAVRAKRGNTSFEESSQKVNEVVGRAIQEGMGKNVNLDLPDWTCHIEIVGEEAFCYSDRNRGPGGLPVGVSGEMLALLSGGIDSPVAAWEIAKRGASVRFVHFHGQPFADPSSVRQAGRLASHLRPWIGESKLWLIPFGDIQSEIVTAAPMELRVVLYRRFMMRIAEALADREGYQALVTGESLGQVASQTIQNLRATNDAVDHLPVFRPLIGRDKIEIEAIAKRLGTYEISITPHQDCCVLFIPRQVTTRASLPQLERAESELEIDTLVEKGVANAELQTL
jgi:thiamine biosynthesis protein ThiI